MRVNYLPYEMINRFDILNISNNGKKNKKNYV